MTFNTLILFIGYCTFAYAICVTVKYIYIGVLVLIDWRNRSKYSPAISFIDYVKSQLEEQR